MSSADWHRPSRRVCGTKRWKRLRIEALRRDGFACVRCGARHGLEVDHVQPVRDAPGRAYDLANLQALCKSCHAAKTAGEVGLPEISPERRRWRELVADMRPKPIEQEVNNA